MTQRDYYEILEVSKTATPEEIKVAYRRMAMQYHPDRNQGDASAEDKFKEAAEAYEVLSDTDKRSRYDRFGHQGVKGAPGFQEFNNINDVFSAFGDIFGNSVFGDLFGGSGFGGGQRQGGRRRQSRGTPGNDQKVRLTLTLEEIATGVEKTIKLRHWKTCTTCTGTGAKPASASNDSGKSSGNASGGYTTCTTCDGSGELRQVSRSVFGQFVNISACATCGGTGEILKDPCDTCEGEGRIEGESTVKVTIPAGVRTGNYLTVTGKGQAGRRGGQAGDAIVVIEEKEHEFFDRDEDDIYDSLVVDFPTAALGGEFEITTLQGTSTVKIEAGTQPGTEIRLKGKGIPHLNSRGSGDHIIRFTVFVPTSLTGKEKSTLKDLMKGENFQPRDNEKGFFEKVKEVFT